MAQRGERLDLPPISDAAERMVALARRSREARALEQRALDRATREPLLAQASDRAFILETGTTLEYARRRVLDHLERFGRLCDGLVAGGSRGKPGGGDRMAGQYLPGLDYRIYA